MRARQNLSRKQGWRKNMGRGLFVRMLVVVSDVLLEALEFMELRAQLEFAEVQLLLLEEDGTLILEEAHVRVQGAHQGATRQCVLMMYEASEELLKAIDPETRVEERVAWYILENVGEVLGPEDLNLEVMDFMASTKALGVQLQNANALDGDEATRNLRGQGLRGRRVDNSERA